MKDKYKRDHKNIIKVFKGDCHGVVLERRKDWENSDDPHICFFIITEDDGNWFESKTGISSCFWMPDLIEQLNLALQWMNEHCLKTQYGWDLNKQVQ